MSGGRFSDDCDFEYLLFYMFGHLVVLFLPLSRLGTFGNIHLDKAEHE